MTVPVDERESSLGCFLKYLSTTGQSYSSHDLRYGSRSLVIDKCSFRLFILGFRVRIHEASRVFRAAISFSIARMVQLTSKSDPSWSSSLCFPSGLTMLRRLLLAMCSFTRTLSGLPVSPMYRAWQVRIDKAGNRNSNQ